MDLGELPPVENYERNAKRQKETPGETNASKKVNTNQPNQLNPFKFTAANLSVKSKTSFFEDAASSPASSPTPTAWKERKP